MLAACNPGDIYKCESGPGAIETLTRTNDGGTISFSDAYSYYNGTVNGVYSFTIDSTDNGVYKIAVDIDGNIYKETFRSGEITFSGYTYRM